MFYECTIFYYYFSKKKKKSRNMCCFCLYYFRFHRMVRYWYETSATFYVSEWCTSIVWQNSPSAASSLQCLLISALRILLSMTSRDSSTVPFWQCTTGTGLKSTRANRRSCISPWCCSHWLTWTRSSRACPVMSY